MCLNPMAEGLAKEVLDGRAHVESSGISPSRNRAIYNAILRTGLLKLNCPILAHPIRSPCGDSGGIDLTNVHNMCACRIGQIVFSFNMSITEIFLM